MDVNDYDTARHYLVLIGQVKEDRFRAAYATCVVFCGTLQEGGNQRRKAVREPLRSPGHYRQIDNHDCRWIRTVVRIFSRIAAADFPVRQLSTDDWVNHPIEAVLSGGSTD